MTKHTRNKPTLNKSAVDNMKPGEPYLMDAEIPGFGARCQRQDVSYFYRYRNADGAQKYITLGRRSKGMTVTEARRKARTEAGKAQQHRDRHKDANEPAHRRDTMRASERLEAVVERYIAEHMKNLSPKSQTSKKHYLHENLIPAYGHKKLVSITAADINKLYEQRANEVNKRRGVKEISAANRMYDTIRAFFNWCIDEKLYLDDNPCQRCAAEHAKAEQRLRRNERYLTGDELKRLLSSLGRLRHLGLAHPAHCDVIRLLVLTGCRKSEITQLKWDEVDLHNGMLNLQSTKTGSSRRVLSGKAKEFLASLPRVNGNPYVFPGETDGEPVKYIYRTWMAIREDAGLDDVRLHDIRHTFASTAASSGVSLYMVSKMLGHSGVKMTERYAHLFDRELKEAADAVGERLAEAFGQ